ncbi:MAG: hypothetical protein DYG89_51080 [Caldilinea sp. CFX5]|nr:hypothetical protein [Caldilinea sp. CFX5]
MKWQKLLLFLAGSGAAFGCVVLLGPVLTRPIQLHGLGQDIGAPFRHWAGFPLPTAALEPATWWTVCAVVVIDLLYLFWRHRRHRGRADHEVISAPFPARGYLSADDYEALLRQRHAALLARYQDPGLVQFLLNREAARAQRLEQWFAVSEGRASTETNATPTSLPVSEQEAQRRADRPALALLANPIGA